MAATIMTYVMTNLARSADSNDYNQAAAFRYRALRLRGLRKTSLAGLRQACWYLQWTGCMGSWLRVFPLRRSLHVPNHRGPPAF